MNLTYDSLLSNVAFNCNLRHYIQGLARCMLHKHNCLGNDAQRPDLPEAGP